MPDFVVSAYEAYGIRTLDAYHDWIVRRAPRAGVMSTSLGTPKDIAVAATPAVARIDFGQWLADCPNPTCNSAMTLIRDQRAFMCGGCFNEDVPGRAYRPVEWLVVRAAAEEMVLARLCEEHGVVEHGHMMYDPREEALSDAAQKRLHHSFTAYKTWSVGAVLPASEMNTYIRDNGNETAVAKVTTQGDIVYATAANALARLAKGTATQLLAMNAGATAPEWVTAGSGMKKITGTGYQFYVDSASNNPYGVAGASTASVDTYVAYVELKSSTAEKDELTHVVVSANTGAYAGANTHIAVQIATGGAASETAIAMMIVPLNGISSGAVMFPAYVVPFPIMIEVAASSRISIRYKFSATGGTSFTAAANVGYVKASDIGDF